MPKSLMKSRNLPEHMVIMVGAGGVGKSALTLRFVFGDFMDEYDPTQADSYNRKITVDGADYDLEILDTAGQEEYAAIRDNYYRNGDGFVCVFSITERESFMAMQALRDQICRALDNDHPPFVLVGNKVDLEQARQVAYEEGLALATQWGNCAYVEASARTKYHVDEVYQAVLRRIIATNRAKMPPMEEKKPSKFRLFCCL